MIRTLVATLLSSVALTAADRPNVILVLADDLGPGDLSCYGGKTPTPNIDRMAKEGVRFTRYYAPAPICSPSRCGTITGQFPGRWRITSYLQTRAGNKACGQADFLDPDAPSLPRALKAAGYKTAHVGKWHLGGGRDVVNPPKFAAYGYDLRLGTWESPEPHPDITARDWIWSADDKVKRWERTGWMVDRTLDFLKAHADGPCFVNLWLDDPHTPWVPTADDQTVTKKGQAAGKGPTPERLAKVMTELDRQVGRLLDAVRARKGGRPTVVLFLSDNGPLPSFDRARTVGLRGSKLSLYEGGTRLPFIAWGPGSCRPGRRMRPPCCPGWTCSRPCASCAGRTAEGVHPGRGGPECGTGREVPEADEATVLGVRPQPDGVRLPGGEGPEPERGGAGRGLEAARERRRDRGRAVRRGGRPARVEGRRGGLPGRGADGSRSLRASGGPGSREGGPRIVSDQSAGSACGGSPWTTRNVMVWLQHAGHASRIKRIMSARSAARARPQRWHSASQ